MKDLTNQLVKEIRLEAIKEISKYGSPPLLLFEISEHHAILLADKYNANKKVILAGSYLADYKLGLALKQNRIQDHVKMSCISARKLLKRLKIEDKISDEIIHCIEAHHGTIPYKSLEAEIVANADCYRFLTMRGVVGFINNLSQRNDQDINGIIKYVEQKANEKWNVISLKEVKKELSVYYKEIQKLVYNAKNL